jgi:hypothetical protein
MLTDIRALADHFLIALPNINKHFWRRCRGERRFAEITLSLAIILYYTFILLFFYLFIFIFMDNLNSIPIIEFFAPSETSHRPWESTSPAPNYDLCPELIAIGQNQPFSIAEVLSFNQEDNALLATPRESVNLSINSGLDLALQDHVFPRYFHIGLNHITFGRVFLSLSISKGRYVFICGHPSCTSLHKKFLEIEKESSPRRGKEVSIAYFQTSQSHNSAIQPILELNKFYYALSLEPPDNPMNLSRHPMHKKEDREEQHQWLEGIKNPCAITIEWIDKTNLRDNPRGILNIHEESSLEFENERNNSEHGSYFINTSPSPCSYKTSLQSICLSILTTFEISNPLFFSIYKNFKRAVVDAYVYNKYCRSR